MLPILPFAYHVRWASTAFRFPHLSASAVQNPNILRRQALHFAMFVMKELTSLTPLLLEDRVLQFAYNVRGENIVVPHLLQTALTALYQPTLPSLALQHASSVGWEHISPMTLLWARLLLRPAYHVAVESFTIKLAINSNQL